MEPPRFKCPSCCKMFGSMLANAKHQRFHKAEKNFHFTCPGPTCVYKYETYTGLKRHITDLHSPSVAPSVTPAIAIQCKVGNCAKSVSSVKNLMHHTIKDHLDQKVEVLCPLSKYCHSENLFTSTGSFRVHLSTYHEGWRDDCTLDPDFAQSVSTSVALDDCDMDADVEFFQDDTMNIDTDEMMDVNSDDASFDHDSYLKLIARFYLMLEAECFLPESTIQVVCDHLILISELIQQQTKCNLQKELKVAGLDEMKITSITNSVLTSDVFYSAHHKDARGFSLTTDYLRKEYFKKNFVYVKPNEVPLDTTDRIDGHVVHHVPIKATLELLLQDTSIQDQIEESFLRVGGEDPNIIRDYYDGEVCKSRPHDPERIDVILYQDGFGAGKNPLGSAASRLEMVGTYFTIGNLTTLNRSKTDSIYLTLLIEGHLLKNEDYGPDKCFKPLVDEMKTLATEGIKFKSRMIPVVLQFVAGDNLASNMWGGFSQSFAGDYFCRFCEVTRADFHNNHCTVKPFRTQRDYEEALQELRIEKQTSNLVTHRGVKRYSELNDIPNFKVCDPGLPVCLGHDIFLGVLSWDLSAMFTYFVENHWFTWKRLGKLVEKFKYQGSDCNNKPAPPHHSGKKLGGHAVQNWCLLRLLPFIIQNRIKDPNDETWQLYLKLKKIVEYVCAPILRQEDVDILKQLVCEYVSERAEVLHDAKIKPKVHYLLHYSDLIRLMGPLIHLWTLRFEAKHQFFKRAARVVNNTINLGYSLAHRYQVYLAYLSTGVIFESGLGIRHKCSKLNPELYDHHIRTVLLGEEFQAPDIMVTNSVSFDGIDYKKDTYLLLEKSASGDMEIGLIKVITMSGVHVKLVIEKYAANFWTEYGVFKINLMSLAVCVVNPAALSNPCQQSVYDFKDELCFSLKHIVV